LLHLSFAKEVRSPRYYYLQPDFPTSQSSWRAIKERRGDGGFMRFLGVPVFAFDDLVGRAQSYYRRATRRPSRFNLHDIVAVALRYLVTMGRQEQLQVEFFCAASVMSRALTAGLKLLDGVLRGHAQAQLRIPRTQAELDTIWDAICEQKRAAATGRECGTNIWYDRWHIYAHR
jgi:hypothetical protein